MKPEVRRRYIGIFGIFLMAVAVLIEVFSRLTGRWPTGYNWVLAVVGGLIISVQLRPRNVEIKRWMWVVMGILLVLLLILRFTKRY